MKNVNVNRLPLLDCWYDNNLSKKWKVNLPFTPKFPLWSGISTNESSVVYFELEPGNELGEHSDSSEEILFVISGNASVVIENESYEVSEGELVVIPASKSHFIMNTGVAAAKFLGFFPSNENRSTFTEDVSPVGSKVL